MQKQSFWIWHYGDYEIFHTMQLNMRREVRGKAYPPFWRLCSPNISVKFLKNFECEDENVKILTSFGRIKSLNLETENSPLLSGIIDVTVIYSVPSTGKINSVSLDMPMEHMLSEKIETLTNAKIENIEVTNIGSEKYDVKILLKIHGYENKHGEISILRDLVELETPIEKHKGLTIYFIKPGDTLWKIAKRFHTTIEHISEMNNIENPDIITSGRALII